MNEEEKEGKSKMIASYSFQEKRLEEDCKQFGEKLSDSVKSIARGQGGWEVKKKQEGKKPKQRIDVTKKKAFQRQYRRKGVWELLRMGLFSCKDFGRQCAGCTSECVEEGGRREIEADLAHMARLF